MTAPTRVAEKSSADLQYLFYRLICYIIAHFSVLENLKTNTKGGLFDVFDLSEFVGGEAGDLFENSVKIGNIVKAQKVDYIV